MADLSRLRELLALPDLDSVEVDADELREMLGAVDEAQRKLAAELNPQHLCDDMRSVAVRLRLGLAATLHDIDMRIDDLVTAEEELRQLREAAGALVAAADALGDGDASIVQLSQEEKAREALRRLLEAK